LKANVHWGLRLGGTEGSILHEDREGRIFPVTELMTKSKQPVTLKEILVSSLAQTDALESS
jgi:hypothetical protein